MAEVLVERRETRFLFKLFFMKQLLTVPLSRVKDWPRLYRQIYDNLNPGGW
jgi:hypothetical protein